MKRDELFALAKMVREAGKAKDRARAAVQRELIACFRSPQGQEALRRAPRVTVEFEPNFPLQEQPVERIVELIMQELD